MRKSRTLFAHSESSANQNFFMAYQCTFRRTNAPLLGNPFTFCTYKYTTMTTNLRSSSSSLMHLTFYAKKELHNRECMGPGEGTVS